MMLAAFAVAVQVDAFLCDTSQHAVEFAAAIAQGDTAEIAKDNVGRSARREVCGLYRGKAAVETAHVVLDGGVAYKLTQVRFLKDNRVAWRAERTFTPADVLAAEQHI